MDRAELAARLVAADDSKRVELLTLHAALADVELAYALKNICLDDGRNSPILATGVAASLRLLSGLTNDPEVKALELWIAGFTSVVAEGQIERAVTLLEEAEALLLSLGKPHTAASTQVNKLYALALLGRYDEAIACGLRAREVLIAHGDVRAAAKIEHNIGNIYLRRDLYKEAKQFQLAARERFASLNDQKLLAYIDNNLAIIYTAEHKFRRAEQLYDQALKSAEASGLILTQAEIEASIGNLALFQGHYDRALDYLERSRRKYAALGMPHLSAVAEQEIADAYLELNLVSEAVLIYERIIKTFARHGMQGELARASAQYGRALILLGETDRAHALLTESRKLYAAEGNPVGEATVMLTEAQLHYAERNYEEARQAAALAEEPFAAAGTWRRRLLARWLRGEASRAQGQEDEARRLIEATLRDAELQLQPEVSHRCHTSLGLLAMAGGDVASAEASFKRAVSLIEDLRTPLPAEEFRTAFLADKQTPYAQLARLCLQDESRDRAGEALRFVDEARSRALVDVLGGALKPSVQPRDVFESQLLGHLENLKGELSWFYSRINRPAETGSGHDALEMKALHEAVRERESKMMEIVRQLQQRNRSLPAYLQKLDVSDLQQKLGAATALVEYTCVDGQLLAFVVTDEGVAIVRDLGSEAEVEVLLRRLRFQIDTLRYGARRMGRRMPDLTARIQHHLRALYDILLGPVEARVGGRRLVIVPHGALYYLPFHALYDGSAYVVERREIAYSPSAVVLLHCLEQPRRPLQRALLMGVSDEQAPHIRDEISTLAPLFPEAVALLNERATLAALKEFSLNADVVHLACHGQFRPDNPLFSSLRLGDCWLTLRDAYDLNLSCGLLTLSACETGVHKVAPGDELIGLARGFFSAGAPSLLLSLWKVDDEATSRLMASFYKRLLGGDAPAAALRDAQLQMLATEPHPFFWAPFMILGRW